jgi:uncharacterized membrane protein YuzA (DUF378 family)
MASFLKPLYLVVQFLLYLGGFYVGLLGAYKMDLFQILFPKSCIRMIEISIGIATLIAILSRFL